MDTRHDEPDIDLNDPDTEQLLCWLEAAQTNMPPTQALLNAIVTALNRKNQLISVLAEALMESDCDCTGCIRMRAVVLNEISIMPELIGATKQ